MAKFPIVVVKEKRSSVGAQEAVGRLSLRVTWYDKNEKDFRHLELDTHLSGVLGDTALVQGVPVRAVDGAYQIELGDEDIPSEYDISAQE